MRTCTFHKLGHSSLLAHHTGGLAHADEVCAHCQVLSHWATRHCLTSPEAPKENPKSQEVTVGKSSRYISVYSFISQSS